MRRPIESGAKNLWPLAAICCLGIIGFVIASMIILALIPVYLPKKEVTVANLTTASDLFYLQFSSDADIDSSVTGSVENTDEISSALGLTNAKILSGTSQSTFVRRRRGSSNSRRKRTLKTNFLYLCAYVYQSTCISDFCRNNVRVQVKKKVASLTTIPSVSCRIRSGGVSKSYTFKLAFIGLISVKPTGFAGESSTFQFIAIRSGAFNDPLIWADGIVPYGRCSVVIPAGITVTLARSILEIRMIKCDIYGALALGSGSSTFTFNYSPNIIVRSGGLIQDFTSNRRLRLPESSLITILSGGGFSAAGTVIQKYSSGVEGDSITVSSASGPFTCGILSGGAIRSYQKVTFIAIQSGGFTSGSTFLGGIAPSAEFCSATACGVQVESGVTLSTADLNGVMSINIDEFNVPLGAVFELGSSGSTSGFKFGSAVKLNILGSLSFVGSGGGILIPAGSNLNIFGSGKFTSSIASFIQVFNILTGVNIGTPQTLGLSFTGPYFVTVPTSGLIIISLTGINSFDNYNSRSLYVTSVLGPGITDTTMAMPVSPSIVG